MPPPRRSTPRSPQHAALGEAVERLRLAAGFTQEELAERMDSDFTQVGGIERGIRNPSYAALVRIAEALGTRPGTIVTLADQVLDEGGAAAQPAGSD